MPARVLMRALAADVVASVQVGTDPLEGDGPIGWPGYGGAHARAAERSGESESVVCGTGTVAGVPVTLVAFEFGFLGGSIGHRTGQRVRAALAQARERGTPVVSLVATGGSRTQEGMAALSQLHRIATEMGRTRLAGVPQLAVALDPTTGGGWATLASGADVTLATPGAQIGFAGSRVRPPGDEAAYTAEGQFAAGHVDAVVPERDLPAVVGRWVRLLTRPAVGPVAPPAALGAARPPRTGWEAVSAARSPRRPRADAYLDAHFDWREDIRGDRVGGVDDGVACGFGWRGERSVAYAAQLGTPTTPTGFRTAARLVRLADRLGVPVLTLVDTVGAANDGVAERAGAGGAIGALFAAIAEARVPVTTLVVGEGGSGGALAFASSENTWMAPDSYFSVTSPEAAAAILKRDPSEVPATADQLRLRPQDVVGLGLARGIVRPGA